MTFWLLPDRPINYLQLCAYSLAARAHSSSSKLARKHIQQVLWGGFRRRRRNLSIKHVFMEETFLSTTICNKNETQRSSFIGKNPTQQKYNNRGATKLHWHWAWRRKRGRRERFVCQTRQFIRHGNRQLQLNCCARCVTVFNVGFMRLCTQKEDCG